MRKILIFSHSAQPGGAENALRKLVHLLKRNQYAIQIVFPETSGTEIDYYAQQGIPCSYLPCPKAIPSLHIYLQNIQKINWDIPLKEWQHQSFDMVLTNTISIFQGALVAQALELPHLLYAHESFLDRDILPHCFSTSFFQSMVEESCTHIISCSHATAKQFASEKLAVPPVLVPYDFTLTTIERTFDENSVWVIQVIGTQSQRKNVLFAVKVVYALHLTGYQVRLDIIGKEGSASSRLITLLENTQIPYQIKPQQDNPYQNNLAQKVVTLVCSQIEPYGLTIPESLRYGIPVLASKSGGPEEILSDFYLCDIGDCTAFAKKLIAIFTDYSQHVEQAYQHYQSLTLQQINSSQRIQQVITEVCASKKTPSNNKLQKLLLTVQQTVSIQHIASTLLRALEQFTGSVKTPQKLLQIKLEQEMRKKGSVLTAEMRTSQLIPFDPQLASTFNASNSLNHLIYLAANAIKKDDYDRSLYLSLFLSEQYQLQPEKNKVLFYGNPLSLVPLILSALGFNVNVHSPHNPEIRKVFATYSQALSDEYQLNNDIFYGVNIDKSYDYIICLDHIDQEPDIFRYIDHIDNLLSNDGFLIINDNLANIKNYDFMSQPNNLVYAGQLPFLLQGRFLSLSHSRRTYANPYIFRKTGSTNPSLPSAIREHHEIYHFIISQMENGI